MSGDGDRLSVRAAAAAAGPAPALDVGGRTCSYAELARLVDSELRRLEREWPDAPAYPLVAHNTLATVVTLLALMERSIPALLLHPRLTTTERDALLADARAAQSWVRADAAAIIHTSGTTGQPRGAVLTRAALLASAAASEANLGWRDDDRWLACMPVARVGGLSILTRCLAARRTVVLEDGFDVAGFPALLVARRVTLASLVPTMLARLLEAHPDWRPPAQLRAVLVGGAAAPEGLLRRAAERGVPVVQTYGLTETCSQVAATPYASRYEVAQQGAVVPLPTVAMRIVDGRIEVAGPMLMAGYWDCPPLAPGAWFDTGDLGRFDARGRLLVHARRVDLIVTGGENVYPAEIERELERCPGIAAAAVFGLDDATWGQTVAMILVAEGPTPPGESDLARFIAARLAPYKHPRHFRFVSKLPQTPAGKLDRRALALLADGLRPLRG